MLKRQTIEINQLCDGLTESISYQDNQIYIYNQNTKLQAFNSKDPRVKTINNFAMNSLSQTFSIQQENQYPQIKNMNKFKCFKCFGIKNKITDHQMRITVQQKCIECNGSQYINQDNGIASLLQQVLILKYPQMFRKNESSKKNPFSFFGTAKSIEEEQYEVMENSKSECQACKNQLTEKNMYVCQVCSNFYLCSTCYNKKAYNHTNTHKIVTKEAKQCPILNTRFYLDSKMKKISQEVQPLQVSHNLEKDRYIELKCDSCQQLIEECYESCLNCEQQGFQYVICATCSQSGRYYHYDNHQLAMRTTQSSKLNKLYSKSSLFQSSNIQTFKNQKKDYYSSRIRPSSSQVGVYLDDNCSIQNQQDMGYNKNQQDMGQNKNQKYSELFELFPKIDNSYSQSQEEYENKKSDVTPYDKFKKQNDQYNLFNMNLFNTPKKSISPIKNELVSNCSTQVTYSPKKSIGNYIGTSINTQNKEEGQIQNKNLQFSSICIDLEASVYEPYFNKSIDMKSYMKKQQRKFQETNIDLQSSLDFQFNSKIQKRQQQSNVFKSKICIDLQVSTQFQALVKPIENKFKSIKSSPCQNIYFNFYEQQTEPENQVNLFSLDPPLITQSYSQSRNNLECFQNKREESQIHTSFHENAFQEYIFEYECDICKVNPIKNLRYHCKECQDYDLCEKCYLYRKQQHQHLQFLQINGLQLLKNQRKSIIKNSITSIKGLTDVRKTSFFPKIIK